MRADDKTGEVGGKSRVTDYLKNEVAERMFERFEVGLSRFHPICTLSDWVVLMLVVVLP